MIIVDAALLQREKQNNPIKVAIIGAGEMGKGMINQITKHTPGMIITATYSRSIEKAIQAYHLAGISNYKIATKLSDYEAAIELGYSVITDNIDLICEGAGTDILVEVTGTIEFAASTIIKAFENRKHVLSFNAELDATIGPILNEKAKAAGVMYGVGDGDQPGVTMNLYRYVKGMGFNPLVCGNIKGMQDHYRTPATQKKFAAFWGMNPNMATNFADGTKISMEQACIANATGMKVAKRGMLGFESNEHVDNLTHLFDVDELKENGGIVDYLLGAKPGPGVFIYATSDDPLAVKYLDYGKLGKGPLYSFYVPYHLLFFEIASSIVRMIDFNDIVIAPESGMHVDVIATAKTELHIGDIIDGIGGFKTYGICENYPIAKKERLLPMGLAEGCIVKKEIKKDGQISYEDVDLPDNMISHGLRIEQNKMF